MVKIRLLQYLVAMHNCLDTTSWTLRVLLQLFFFRNKNMCIVIFKKIVVVTKVYKIAEFVCIVFYNSDIIKSKRLSTQADIKKFLYFHFQSNFVAVTKACKIAEFVCIVCILYRWYNKVGEIIYRRSCFSNQPLHCLASCNYLMGAFEEGIKEIVKVCNLSTRKRITRYKFFVQPRAIFCNLVQFLN